MNLYEIIKYNLLEISTPLAIFKYNTTFKTYEISMHLLKCLLIQDKNDCLEHWEHKLYTLLHSLPRLKHNKYPSYKMLKSLTIDYLKLDFINDIDNNIADMCEEENIKVPPYNGESLCKCIINYYDWLAKELSLKGSVSFQLIKAEINNLIYEYNNSIMVGI